MVDLADVFSSATETAAAGLIEQITSQHGLNVVVYTQHKPGSTERSTEQDAIALKLTWRLSDGLVVMWNTNRKQCVVGGTGNGEVQLYSDTRVSATRLSALKRQRIFDELMVPHLLSCNADEALLAALEGIAAEARTPTGTPPGPSGSPISTEGACGDDAFKLSGYQWDEPFEWYFNEASVPDEYDADEVLDVLMRSADNITSGRNDCGLPDRISATATYAGTTRERPCVGDVSDGYNTVGFDVLPPDAEEDFVAFVCPYGGRGEIVEADIHINSEIPWALSEDDCRGFEELLEATMTHEFGHVFGLGHVSEERHGDLTMSPTSNGACNPEEISLGLGDVLGLEELY